MLSLGLTTVDRTELSARLSCRRAVIIFCIYAFYFVQISDDVVVDNDDDDDDDDDDYKMTILPNCACSKNDLYMETESYTVSN